MANFAETHAQSEPSQVWDFYVPVNSGIVIAYSVNVILPDNLTFIIVVMQH